ncbi:MAG: biotin/lipoyl-binding protein [Anderseniella sp.]
MIVFLTLCYCGLLFLLVKVGVIKLNTFWKLSPLLWGLVLFIVLFIPMQWGAPSGPVRTYNAVIEIVPNVTGEVVSVPVKPLVKLKKGDILFEIDPVPFQAAVDQKQAQLAEAQQAVPQLKAALDAALAAVVEAEANRNLTKDEYDRYRLANENARKQGNASTPFSEKDVEQRRLTFLASEASVSRAKANAEQARLAYTSEINGVNTTVARLEADLRKSEYELEQTQVRAPAEGFVLGLSLQPGQRVSNLPLRSWMAFVPVANRRIVVAIPQTRLRHVNEGQMAEVTFAFLPGEVVTARVERAVPMNVSGQLPPSGVLPSLGSLYAANEVMAVVLRLDEPRPELDTLPGGADGTAAIYTDSVSATHVIRKIMIRMDAWLNYIKPL